MSFGGSAYGSGAYGGAGNSGDGTIVIRTTGRVDEQFGATVVGGGSGPPINITADGFVDERFGTSIITGGNTGIVVVPTVSPDENFGITQFIAGDLSIYYGPTPTPLIADAPYAQYARTTFVDQPPAIPAFVPNDLGTIPGGSRYRFIITDMLGNVQGEVQQASQKSITQVLDNMCTASFTLKVSNPMVDYILDNACLCKCYRQPVNRNFAYRLLLVGDVTTDEEDTSDETGTITFTVTDALNRLAYRLLGKTVDSSNHGTGFASGTPTSPKDIADVIGDMLLNIDNDAAFGRAGVTLGIRGPNTPSSYIDPVYFTAFATQLALYTNTLDGVDFLLEPQEPYSYAHYPGQPGTNPYITGGPDSSTPPQEIVKGTSVQDTIIAKLNVYFPMGNFLQRPGPPGVYSKNRPYAVFEYGTGKRNVQGYQRIRNRSQMSNRWWSLPDGFPSSNAADDPLVSSTPSTPTAEGTLADSIAKYGGYEQVDSGDLGTGAHSLRQLLVNSEASTTAVPQQQITFTPTINCDEDWTLDYFLGDIAIVRAYVAEANNDRGSWRFNGTMRLYGISGTIDDNEQEQISITTIPPSA